MGELAPFVVSIPAAVNYKPAGFSRNASFLDESRYTPDEPERGRWDRLLTLLPERRRASIDKCGRFALHVMRQTHAGAAECLQPVSCCDRTACPLCTLRYWLGQGAQRLGNLTAVTRAAQCKLAVVEARATVSSWRAAVRVAGCDVAEGRGRLCDPAQGCRACAVARVQHSQAGEVETELQRALVAAWGGLVPHTGGCYITAPEPGKDGLEIVIRLLVPTVAVHGNTFARADVPGWEAFESRWRDICVAAGGTSRGIHVSVVTDGAPLVRAVLNAHLPAFERLHRTGAHLTQEDARVLARAAGLTGLTSTGKVRKIQRSAWFGIFAGRTQAATLNTLQISRFENAAEVLTTVVDCYKILDKTESDVVCQSTRYGARRIFPAAMFRRDAYCDLNAAPLCAPDPVTWGNKNPWQAELDRYEQVTRGRVGGRIVLSGPAYRSAINKVSGTLFTERGFPARKDFAGTREEGKAAMLGAFA